MNAPVPQRWTTSIAGVDFICSGNLPSPVQVGEGSYGEFCEESGGQRVQIAVETGPIADPGRVSFRGGRGWCHESTDDGTQHIFVRGRGGANSKRLSYYGRLSDGGRLKTDLSLAADAYRSAAPFRYPLDQIALTLALEDGIVLHATSVIIDGRAYVFVGESGKGKSTIARLLSPLSTVLSDERTVVRQRGSDLTAYGTPWPSSAGAARNVSGRVAGLFFLEHGSKDVVKPLRREEARDQLLRCASVPFFDDRSMTLAIEFVQGLARGCPCYRLEFLPTMRVVDAIRAL
ncbi:MAG: hypothetical protein AAF654_04935 [Myxococcota bacterium]